MQLKEENQTRMSETGTDPFVGRTFDGYRVEEVIGRGGMGVVYKATQLSLNRPVAIKVLPADFADHPQFLERFHREVDILSRLSHPNVVTVFERGDVDGRQYVVMEYVKGTSLRALIEKGPLPSAEALDIVRSVLAGLEHAHRAGIVHRDVKPENVLIAPGGIVKVADFGLSRLLGPDNMTRLTHTHLLLGTFEYMAPEQREKAKEADERSDLYATGVVLYELIAGELPIGAFEPLSAKRPQECDQRLDDIVQKSLDKAPERRFQRASEMGDAVSRILSHAAVEPPKPAAKAPPPAARHVKTALEGVTDPWSLGSYFAGFWMLIMMALLGTDLSERGWLMMSAGCGVVFFVSVFHLHKKRMVAAITLAILIGAATAGGVYVVEKIEPPPPAEPKQIGALVDWQGDATILAGFIERPDVTKWLADVVGVDPVHVSQCAVTRVGMVAYLVVPPKRLREDREKMAKMGAAVAWALKQAWPGDAKLREAYTEYADEKFLTRVHETLPESLKGKG